MLHPDGVFLRREALAYGLDDRDLGAAVRAGLLTRVRQGAYVATSTWRSRDEMGRHLIRARAVLLSHEGRVALSHVSGAIAHGLRVWGADLDRVHVVRLDGQTGRSVRDVVHHSSGWATEDVVESAGLRVMTPAACAVGVATSSSVESGLVTVDSAYDLGLASELELRDVVTTMRQWPGTSRLQITMRLAQSGAQSVGESRMRFLCWAGGLPRPVLQYAVYDDAGQLVGITDFAWPARRLLGEFDGRVKYGRLLRQGEDPGAAVFREKVREDRLREVTGWRVVRVVWDDLGRPRQTVARIERALNLTNAA